MKATLHNAYYSQKGGRCRSLFVHRRDLSIYFGFVVVVDMLRNIVSKKWSQKKKLTYL
uniref:Uncharacterized protein n=1 Tax=Lepeophtheirus salmonis TaxID=72036 RepID=A0A0K2VBS5_LEPSM